VSVKIANLTLPYLCLAPSQVLPRWNFAEILASGN